MRFEREDKKPIEPVSEKQLRRQLGYKRGGDNTFAILTASSGNYVQMLGGGVACCLEWQDFESRRHSRAYVVLPRVPWKEPTKLGSVLLKPNEFIGIDMVIEAFCAFLNGSEFPEELQWRDVTEELAIQWPGT